MLDRLIPCAALALASASSASVPAPPPAPSVCSGPHFDAVDALKEKRLYAEAEGVARPLLKKSETALCAARKLVEVDQARKEEASWSRAPGKAGDDLGDGLKAALPWAAMLVLLLMLGGLYRLLSWRRRSWGWGRWRVRQVAAGSDPGILSAWYSALASGSGGTTVAPGLLSGQAVPLPRAILIGPPPQGATDDLLKDAPTIQGVSVSWIARLVMWATRRLRSPRKTFSVAATSTAKSAMLRVDVVDRNNQIHSIAASAAWPSEADAAKEIERMAANVAMRAGYLISGAGPEGLESRLKLREGIALLGDFVSRHEGKALDQAATAFAQARLIDWQDLNAAFYEGVARELQEQHDRAEGLFKLVIERSQVNDPLRGRARYNLAVAKLRRYRPEALLAAETELRALADAKVQPAEIRPFARAALANAIAHKFIFWRDFEPKGDPDFTKWANPEKTKKKEQLDGWSAEIETLLVKAEAAVNDKKLALDEGTKVQLRWLVANARGNHALNRANAAVDPLGLDDAKKALLLEEALEAYRSCEAQIPAGVETLSNIATTLIALGRPTEALDYTRDARQLNAAYEYAYYREAQALLARNDVAACEQFLKTTGVRLPKIGIPSFQQMFRDQNIAFHDK